MQGKDDLDVKIDAIGEMDPMGLPDWKVCKMHRQYRIWQPFLCGQQLAILRGQFFFVVLL